MYIHMYTMAKTIMVSNEAYEKLRKIKESYPSMSYTEVIMNALENTKKTVGNLKEALLKLKLSKEDGKIEKEIKEGWARWMKKYA